MKTKRKPIPPSSSSSSSSSSPSTPSPSSPASDASSDHEMPMLELPENYESNDSGDAHQGGGGEHHSKTWTGPAISSSNTSSSASDMESSNDSSDIGSHVVSLDSTSSSTSSGASGGASGGGGGATGGGVNSDDSSSDAIESSTFSSDFEEEAYRVRESILAPSRCKRRKKKAVAVHQSYYMMFPFETFCVLQELSNRELSGNNCLLTGHYNRINQRGQRGPRHHPTQTDGRKRHLFYTCQPVSEPSDPLSTPTPATQSTSTGEVGGELNAPSTANDCNCYYAGIKAAPPEPPQCSVRKTKQGENVLSENNTEELRMNGLTPSSSARSGHHPEPIRSFQEANDHTRYDDDPAAGAGAGGRVPTIRGYDEWMEVYEVMSGNHRPTTPPMESAPRLDERVRSNFVANAANRQETDDEDEIDDDDEEGEGVDSDEEPYFYNPYMDQDSDLSTDLDLPYSPPADTYIEPSEEVTLPISPAPEGNNPAHKGPNPGPSVRNVLRIVKRGENLHDMFKKTTNDSKHGTSIASGSGDSTADKTINITTIADELTATTTTITDVITATFTSSASDTGDEVTAEPSKTKTYIDTFAPKGSSYVRAVLEEDSDIEMTTTSNTKKIEVTDRCDHDDDIKKKKRKKEQKKEEEDEEEKEEEEDVKEGKPPIEGNSPIRRGSHSSASTTPCSPPIISSSSSADEDVSMNSDNGAIVVSSSNSSSANEGRGATTWDRCPMRSYYENLAGGDDADEDVDISSVTVATAEHGDTATTDREPAAVRMSIHDEAPLPSRPPHGQPPSTQGSTRGNFAGNVVYTRKDCTGATCILSDVATPPSLNDLRFRHLPPHNLVTSMPPGELADADRCQCFHTSETHKDGYAARLRILDMRIPYRLPINYHHGCTPRSFQTRCQSSLAMVKRLQPSHLLRGHKGCVNAVSFNRQGNLLATGSDDLCIRLWRWQYPDKEKNVLFEYKTPHKRNIFQSKFMPHCDNRRIATCSQDGEVRMTEISLLGPMCTLLGSHKFGCHKLGIKDSPNELYSCGEDGQVFNYDIRQPKAQIPLIPFMEHLTSSFFSIDVSPINDCHFVLACRDAYIRIYDSRYIRKTDLIKDTGTIAKLTPYESKFKIKFTYSTCAVYSKDASEIVATYKGNDIFVFNMNDSYNRRYSGHLNNETTKGVNFLGGNSEYIVSGSDCGNVFIWDKRTHMIVQCFKGDEEGIVNVLEPHPSLPVLATGGLDNEVKIWQPTTNRECHTNMYYAKKVITSNAKGGEGSTSSLFDFFTFFNRYIN